VKFWGAPGPSDFVAHSMPGIGVNRNLRILSFLSFQNFMKNG